ncbi:MAG TPA: hypothetical protein VMV57_03665 [Terracidiphilus sp.]|nr:hypothetical protein [Terracidiphilus sp.]
MSEAKDACAQSRGGTGHGYGGAGHGFVGGGHGFGRNGDAFRGGRVGHLRGSHEFGRGAGHIRGGYVSNRTRGDSRYGFGYGYVPYYSGLPYDYGAAYADQEPQPVVYVQPPPVIAQKPEPPAVEPPAEPVIKEYKWPVAEVASSHSNSEPQVFAIVLKDGSTLSALTVYASDDALHYVDPGERHLRVAMSEVDRAATLKLNRARDLNLYLPAAE